MDVPLAGKTIALLRAQGQGGELARGLEALGARILEVPLLAIAPPLDPEPLRAAIAELASFDWVVLTSPNAVAAFVDAARATTVPIASVGPGTSRALRERGLEPALEAAESLQEGLARALIERGVAGKRVLLPQADQAREVLARALADAGARVTAVTAYRTTDGPGDAGVLIQAMDAGALDAICFTSASTVRHLARRIGEPELRRRFAAARPIAASMGPIASAALRDHGVEPRVEAREHTARGLVAAVRAALGG